MKEGAAASCALRDCLSSGDQAGDYTLFGPTVDRLLIAGLSVGASNSVLALYLIGVDRDLHR